MNTILEEIGRIGIVPVVVLDDAEKAVPVAKALRVRRHQLRGGDLPHGGRQKRLSKTSRPPCRTCWQARARFCPQSRRTELWPPERSSS